MSREPDFAAVVGRLSQPVYAGLGPQIRRNCTKRHRKIVRDSDAHTAADDKVLG
jgi:hypothetical protein